MARTVPALDVAALPDHAFGHRSILWWGTLGFVAIEGTVFALAGVIYFYLRSQVEMWPPGAARPDLIWGTLNTLLLLVSEIPNQWTKKAAEQEDLRKVRIGLVVCAALGIAAVGLRALEFTTLNVSWNTNAYGSIVWTILGLHTTHLLTDLGDTLVLTVLMFTGPLSAKRFVDVSENQFYWHFVVGSWLPLYVIVYIAPFFL